ncbi:peroxysomal 3-ketoacyl-CoA thiolase A (THIL) [Datura stramonium]|uniref:Peroxysomal 3-ketoacyl-CoA thiolase A (THIL) n=1 Tax=Datura stramonium TaxID=4076 RepID=A0ABS8UL66_DATST|nr:peroxysomal 3-ketoacyl-CoA thiolase A (THIL) [Datura stramonium]
MASGMEINEENNENKGGMWDLEQKLDQPMDEEAGRLRNMYREKKFSTLLLLRLAYQSLGVVYGDPHLPLANDNGQGGTFALYSLLCRHAKIKTIPNQHRTDEELTTYSRSTFHEHSFAAKTKRWLEAYPFRKNALLILVVVGTCGFCNW